MEAIGFFTSTRECSGITRSQQSCRLWKDGLSSFGLRLSAVSSTMIRKNLDWREPISSTLLKNQKSSNNRSEMPCANPWTVYPVKVLFYLDLMSRFPYTSFSFYADVKPSDGSFLFLKSVAHGLVPWAPGNSLFADVSILAGCS